MRVIYTYMNLIPEGMARLESKAFYIIQKTQRNSSTIKAKTPPH